MLSSLSIANDWNAFLAFRSRRLKGLQTGIAELDKILLGLSGVTILQGAPGSAKSSLAMQIALFNSLKGTPVLIIDRENGTHRFRMRLICCHNSVSSVDVLTSDEEQLGEWVRPIAELPIFHSIGQIKPEEIRTLLNDMWEKFNRPMLLVVDSLQAMPAIASEERMSLQTWMNELDQLKLDMEGRLVIVATSEKSRGQDNYEKASLSASKGAGTIEYRAEIVVDVRRSKDGGFVVEILKNRDGIANVAIDLEPVLADERNPGSFTFRLK